MTDETPTFGSQLREIRSARKLSLQAVADRSQGLTESGLLRIEKGGRTNPQMSTLMAICRGLNIAIEIRPDAILIEDLGKPGPVPR